MTPLSFKAWAATQGYKNHPTDQTVLAEKAWTFCLTQVLESQKKYLELLNVETNNLIELKNRITSYEATIQTYRDTLELSREALTTWSDARLSEKGQLAILKINEELKKC